MDIDALKQELSRGHPDTGAYDSDIKAAADQINLRNRRVSVGSIPTKDVINAVVQADRVSLTDSQRLDLLILLSAESIDPDNSNTRQALASLFGPNTETRTNLTQLAKKTVSRAEELGLGFVRPGEIAEARL